MANLSSATFQSLSQLGATRLVDPSTGPDGPHGTVVYLLVGANGWHNGTRLTHEVNEDLQKAGFEKQTVEGVEYFLVPESASNVPGRLSHYAQTTGVADLQNPPGGGVNAARQHATTPAVTVDPEGVNKFVGDAKDAFDEARDERLRTDEQVQQAIRAGSGSEDSDTVEKQRDAKDSTAKSAAGTKNVK